MIPVVQSGSNGTFERFGQVYLRGIPRTGAPFDLSVVAI
jgi:hypothetical protein